MLDLTKEWHAGRLLKGLLFWLVVIIYMGGVTGVQVCLLVSFLSAFSIAERRKEQLLDAAVLSELDRLAEIDLYRRVAANDVLEEQAHALGFNKHVAEAVGHLCRLCHLERGQSCMIQCQYERLNGEEPERFHESHLLILTHDQEYAMGDH